ANTHLPAAAANSQGIYIMNYYTSVEFISWKWWHLLLLFALLDVVVSQSIIQTLPGYPGILPIKLETGYVSVGEVDEVQLFYYFVESERNPAKDPLVLFLTGGPGCSGFSGLVYENGPLMFDIPAFNGSTPSFLLNTYSWTKIANIIFLDAPVGTGFSYATTSEGYYSSDTKSANQTYTFLRKGYMLGNPLTDSRKNENAKVKYAHRMGLIPDNYYESAKRSCHGEYASPDPNNAECIYYLQLIKEKDNYALCYVWANDPTVREALHIRDGTKPEWRRCNRTLSYVMDIASVLEYHYLLSKKGYRVLVYSGDHDMVIPYVDSIAWINSLNLTIDDNWRPWFVDGQVAGYTERYKENSIYSLTFATGGGHTVPEYKPKQCLAMIDSTELTSSLYPKSLPRFEEIQPELERYCQSSRDGKFISWEWWHLLLLFALFHVVASQSIIQTLPGYPGILPIKLETGYVSVGEVDEVQLFYYFVESERNPVKDPLVLWLTGGPGCSAFSGLVYEIGPLMFDVPAFNGSSPSFFLNPYSWTKIANIIFLDAPVGTGFSYATTSEGYYSSDTKSAKDTYTFLRKWLLEHQRFIENPLYIAGDSYSGILVPMIVLEISNASVLIMIILAANEVGYMPRMSLQGYMLGNPGTDIHMDENARVAYAHRVGLISDEYYQSAKRSCRGEYVSPDPNNAECIYYLQLIKECTGRVNIAQILEPQCSTSWGKRYDDYSKDILMPSQQEERWCRYDNYVTCYVWANDPTVREALHIRDVS
ncbi:hypothetical protein RJ640_018622, partial [Escallonia rubra]